MTSANPAFCIPHSAMEWLPDMDLNHDKQIQSLLCYRYTIGQTSAVKVRGCRTESRLVRRSHAPTLSRFHASTL